MFMYLRRKCTFSWKNVMAWPGFPGKTQKHVTLFLEAFLTVTQICNFWGQCSVLASLALTTVSRGDRISLGRAIMSQHTSWVMGTTRTRIRLFSEDAGPPRTLIRDIPRMSVQSCQRPTCSCSH